MQIYVVSAGDTIYQIASRFRVSPEQIIYDNQITFPNRLTVGQALLIQEGNETGSSYPLVTGGYAYPFIRPWVLQSTLPYLSELLIFSYGFTLEGILVPPQLDEEWMIQTAISYGSRPILVLTPLDETGKFNNYLVHTVLRDSTRKEQLLFSLLSTIQQKNYSGVDIDFEYILAEDREIFAEFVAETSELMRANGYTTSVALAPKTSRDQPGLLYEGKDYALLGAAADQVLLMTYEWGYTYGPPMAVAPLFNVRKVVEYAITEIPPEKIRLGIPNYGYDWALPYERGVTAARTIGNIEAVDIAITHGAEILFDPTALSPYFYYTENGIQHEVWFEDVRSMQAKFELIKEFNLNGVGYWQIMKLFRANWILLAENFSIQK